MELISIYSFLLQKQFSRRGVYKLLLVQIVPLNFVAIYSLTRVQIQMLLERSPLMVKRFVSFRSLSLFLVVGFSSAVYWLRHFMGYQSNLITSYQLIKCDLNRVFPLVVAESESAFLLHLFFLLFIPFFQSTAVVHFSSETFHIEKRVCSNNVSE